MNAIEIILLILGFMSISISFLLSKKDDSSENAQAETVPEVVTRDVWTEKEEALVREQIHQIMTEETKNILSETTHMLNRKSNEKIMQFDEFSSQLLEKINHNHEEVVFMYSMLSEKEKEWKEAAKRPVVQPQPVPVVEEKKQETDKKDAGRTETVKVETPVVHEEKIKPEEPVKSAEKVPDKVEEIRSEQSSEKVVINQKEAREKVQSDSVNQKVVRMHKQGKSVLDISKELNLGQGEVKLTIALYGGNK